MDLRGVGSSPGERCKNLLFERGGGKPVFGSERVVQYGQRYRIRIGYDFIPGWDVIGEFSKTFSVKV